MHGSEPFSSKLIFLGSKGVLTISFMKFDIQSIQSGCVIWKFLRVRDSNATGKNILGVRVECMKQAWVGSGRNVVVLPDLEILR
jgi:hypothetical protein